MSSVTNRITIWKAFVQRQTSLQPVPCLPHLRLHLADEVLPLWGATQRETGDADAPLPYWAFAWGGGLAIATYLRDHPDAVRGKRVFDLASGSGLCAIAALQAGAAEATAVDIDPFAGAAIGLNARANGLRITVVLGDVLDDDPPDADVVLVGDAWYEAELARRVGAWLRRGADAGLAILVGDPGRRYLPADDLRELARYDVRTTTELEDLALKTARVFTMAMVGPRAGSPPGASEPADATPNEAAVDIGRSPRQSASPSRTARPAAMPNAVCGTRSTMRSPMAAPHDAVRSCTRPTRTGPAAAIR